MSKKEENAKAIVIINFEDHTLDCKFLCSYCGLKFQSNNSFQQHLKLTHLSPLYKNLDVQFLFQAAASKLEYPSWIKLPSFIETEIKYSIENGWHSKQIFLAKISNLFQENWSEHLTEWRNNKKIYTSNDLKLILGEAIPMIMEQLERQTQDNSVSKMRAITEAQKETVSYIGGGILRKLYYKTKESDIRSFIKMLSEGIVPVGYQIHNRGGLWACNQTVQQLLLEVQHEFNIVAEENARKLVVSDILQKLDLKNFLLFSDNISPNLQLEIYQKVAKLYITAIAFGRAKQITNEGKIHRKPLRHCLKT